jgi:hypothetical protein
MEKGTTNACASKKFNSKEKILTHEEKIYKRECSIFLNEASEIECWSLGSNSSSFALAILSLPKVYEASLLGF